MFRYIFFVFFNNKTQKKTLSTNEFPGEMILRFRLYLSWQLKWVFYIGTLLKADIVPFRTHFEFRYLFESLVGDNLMPFFMDIYNGCQKLFFFFFRFLNSDIGRLRRNLVQTTAIMRGFWVLPTCYPRCVLCLLSFDVTGILTSRLKVRFQTCPT